MLNLLRKMLLKTFKEMDFLLTKQLKHLSCIPLVVIILILSACEHNKYKSAESLYSQRRYAASIELLDNYINVGKNGAFVTRAELIRSSCYYELGLAAIEKENWALAIRLLKLANSGPADIELAKVYNTLALDEIDAQNIPKAMEYLTIIKNEISTSELVPEVLQIRIKLYLDYYKDKVSAWNDYMFLYDNYPENKYEVLARPFIQRFIDINIDEAVGKAIKKDYDTALEDLFQIRRYPVADLAKVDEEISNIYQQLAEIEIQKQDYFEANRLFLKAMQYNPQKKEVIDQRLKDIAYLYVEKGNDYMQVRDFDTARLYFEKTFEIIPDFDLAKQAIADLATIQRNIKQASDYATEAEKMELNRNYPEAKRLYTLAYQLDKLPYYYERLTIMGNMIEADKDPVEFTKNIINSYQNGLLYRRIQAQKQVLLKRFKIDEIRDSGWKVLRSTGQYKYEARYDLLTPSENLYYVWQVNLRDKNITPLNKISEKIMQ